MSKLHAQRLPLREDLLARDEPLVPCELAAIRAVEDLGGDQLDAVSLVASSGFCQTSMNVTSSRPA